jgi:hypothetical protein
MWRSNGHLSLVVLALALARRGWSLSAIARHTGRSQDRAQVPGRAAAFAGAAAELSGAVARLPGRAFGDDAHVDGTVLFREVVGLGLSVRM